MHEPANGPASTLLHGNATAYSLGFCRIVIFGLWFTLLLPAPIEVLSAVPFELFESFGIFRIIPATTYEWFLTVPVLTVFKGILLLLSLLLCLGCRRYTFLAISFGVLVLFFDAVTKSFGSYSNHAQKTLMYATWIIALFPASDRMSIQPARILRSAALYVTPMVTMTFALALPYSLIGLRRIFAGGLEIFTGDSILSYSAVYSLKYNPYGYEWGLLALEYPLFGTLMKMGFVIITIAEVLSPFSLFSRRLRLVWLVVIIPFHFLSLFTLNIFFLENLILMAVLFTSLPHRFSPRLGAMKNAPIVFYDGACGLCSRFVQFLLKHDRERILHFAPLQGTTAAAGLSKQPEDPGEWSVMYRDESGVHERSSASLRILSRMGGVWMLAGVVLIIPTAIRDGMYRWIAKRRHRLFPASDACLLPKPEDANRFLP